MSFSCQKGEFDRFFNRLDRPVEESRPDRQPDRSVDPTGFHLWMVRSKFGQDLTSMIPLTGETCCEFAPDDPL